MNGHGGKRTGIPWTPQDDELLRQTFTSKGSAACFAAFPHRSTGAVEARICKLHLRIRESFEAGDLSHDNHMRVQDRKFCERMAQFPDERPVDYDIPVENYGLKNPLLQFGCPRPNSGGHLDAHPSSSSRPPHPVCGDGA